MKRKKEKSVCVFDGYGRDITIADLIRIARKEFPGADLSKIEIEVGGGGDIDGDSQPYLINLVKKITTPA